MSILKYFKRVDSKSRPSASVLPDPTGPLSSSISPGAIDLVNERVADVMDASVDSKKGSRGPYQTLTSAQKLLVARRAAEYGTTAAMKFFAKKYPELPKRLKETSVRRLKNLYQEYLRIKLSVHKYRTYMAEIFLGTCPTVLMSPSIVFLIATAWVSWQLPISRSQIKVSPMLGFSQILLYS